MSAISIAIEKAKENVKLNSSGSGKLKSYMSMGKIFSTLRAGFSLEYDSRGMRTDHSDYSSA